MSYLARLKTILPASEYDKVVVDLGDKQLIINDGNYVPKAKFDEKNEQVKNLTTQVDELKTGMKETETKLKEFGKLEGANEEMKTQLTELQNKNKSLVEDSQKKLDEANSAAEARVNKILLDSKVDVALINAGATSKVSQNSVKANLDFEKITLENDEVKGLDDQIKTLKESSAALFFGEQASDESGKEKTVKGTEFKTGKTPDENGTSSEQKMMSLYKTEGVQGGE